jgi:hypothetical protein
LDILRWLLVGAACACSLVAFLRAKRVAKRLEKLTESYWELRYEHGQLRARIARLEPPIEGIDTPDKPARAAAGSTAFVPLSSLKR